MLIQVPVSWGELVDKITILQIKSERITDKAKLFNIHKELEELTRTASEAVTFPPAVVALQQQLKEVNEKLWVIEDDIRDCERNKNFGARFIELARAVYFTNDERFRVKREINDALGSALTEEKSYAAYA